MNPRTVFPAGGGLKNRDWKYVPSAETNLREKFDRVRAEQARRSVVSIKTARTKT